MPKPRKTSALIPLKTLRIFCEGEKTEPNYLNGYIGNLSDKGRKSVVEVQKTRKNTAVQLVEEALKVKNSRDALPDDEYWVVYDRESKSKYRDALHDEAQNMADMSGIHVALNNVCFEYWILLHFVETDAPYESFNDLYKNSSLRTEMLRTFGCDYEKGSRSLFSLIKNLIPQARQRGARVNERGRVNADVTKNKPYQINPYVGVVELLDAIDDFI